MNAIVNGSKPQRAARYAKHSLVVCLRSMLRPVVRMLLKHGMGYRDFAEIGKTVFVEIASDEYGLRGRRTNVSRVAILTGLTRREVARLRTVIDNENLDLCERSTPIADVLSAWHTNKRYTLDDGTPRRLPLRGQGSLEELIAANRSDIPTSAILKELKRVEAIDVRDGFAMANARYYMPASVDDAAVERMGHVVADLAETTAGNLGRLANAGQRRFEGRALVMDIDPGASEDFREFLDQRGSEFLCDVDAWLQNRRVAGDGGRRVGVGAYAIGDAP